MAARLLVPFGAAVAGGAGDSVLAGTLAARLVAGLATRSHWVAVTSWWRRKKELKIFSKMEKKMFKNLILY